MYTKKSKLNEQFYKLRVHLECADQWANTWHIIQKNYRPKFDHANDNIIRQPKTKTGQACKQITTQE
jgi:hypothetical protein